MKTRALTSADVAEVILAVGIDRFYDELVESMTEAFAGYDPAVTMARTRDGFHYEKPDLGLLEWMPTMRLGSFACVKTVGYHPTNPVQRGLPSVVSTTALYDTATGELVALAESTLLTALRTGVASAIASDILAADRALVVGVIGCGAQAVTQLHALSRVRRIDEILAFDVDPSVAATLERRLGLSFPVTVIDEVRRRTLLRDVDLLVTCTSVDIGAGPVATDTESRPWVHVNAIGADFAGKTELPKAFLDRCAVFPDNLDQCLAEGECQQIDPASIVASLPELVRDAERFRSYQDTPTVFDSTGWALEDQVVLEVLLRHACRLNVGSSLELSTKPADPYDPYETLRR